MLYKQKYWNPVLETTPAEKIKQLQLSKFKKIFRWTYERSRFHRRIYDNAGIKPQDVQSFDDIKRVPKVEKSMMRDIQRKAPFPYGEALCVPLDEVTIFRQTSGTTGQPVYQPDTWQDWEWWMECWSYILWAQGYRPGFFSFNTSGGRCEHCKGAGQQIVEMQFLSDVVLRCEACDATDVALVSGEEFLIESIVLSGLGGIVGILSGVLITIGVAEWLDIVLVIDPSITVIALVFSMLIGILFGIIPARKAAAMNPIDALRYE